MARSVTACVVRAPAFRKQFVRAQQCDSLERVLCAKML